ATGAEADVVRAMPEADRAFGPGDYWRVALGLRRFAWAGGRRPSRAALLYLGGDLVHAAALARRPRVPALAYLERGSRWSRRFAEVLVPDERARRSVLRRGEADQRIAVVGDLMVDAVRGGAGRRRLAAEWGLGPEKPIVALFPGSRPYEIRLTIRFFLRAMELLRADHPDAQCVISLSAYGTPDLLRGSDEDALEGTSVTVDDAAGTDGRRGARPALRRHGRRGHGADGARQQHGRNGRRRLAHGGRLAHESGGENSAAGRGPVRGAPAAGGQAPEAEPGVQAGRGHALCGLAQPEGQRGGGARGAGRAAAGGRGAGGGAAVGRREAPRGHEPAAA